MSSFFRFLKLPPFGVILYGIPPLLLLILFAQPYGNSGLNWIQIRLALGISLSLFIVSALLGAVVDTYFRSSPEASFSRILFFGSFAWSFLISASSLIVGYMAFNSYNTSHHTNFMPHDIYSGWSTLVWHLFKGAFFGGLFFLPLNSFLLFLVRRRYRNQANGPSHG